MPDTSNFQWLLREHQNDLQTITSDEEYRFYLEQIGRASAVLDAIAALFGDAFEDDPQRLDDEYKLKVNNAISANLDVYSIWSFMGLVAEKYKSMEASRKAHVKNATNRIDKQKIFLWCDTDMGRFKTMDEAANDIAETFVKQKFRTVRGWMTEWKKLRAAGTP